MLSLPDVTLILVETQTHELARQAILDATSKVQFGEVILYTDQPELFFTESAITRIIPAPNWPDKIQQGTFYYSHAAQAAKTSHVLMMEWDAGIRDVSSWRDDFLKYDMIGAPWVWARDNKREHSVGNGGFMLLSKKLADSIHANSDRFIVATDVHLCREHRQFFEKDCGAVWAPEDVGFQFAYEHGYQARKDAPPSFGYHDVFNWPLALDRDELKRRVQLVMQNQYIVTATPKLRLLSSEWPWMREFIGPELLNAENKFRPVIARRNARTVRLPITPRPRPVVPPQNPASPGQQRLPHHNGHRRMIGYLTRQPGVKA